MRKIAVWANKRSRAFSNTVFIAPKLALLILWTFTVPFFSMYGNSDPYFENGQVRISETLETIDAFFGLVQMKFEDYMFMFFSFLFLTIVLWVIHEILKPYIRSPE